jgi:hypothetical protein
MLFRPIHAQTRIQECEGFAMRTCTGLAAFVTSALLLSQPGAAQNAPDAFPTRPVKLVVPFPPGGPTDLTARLFGQKLSERWGRSSSRTAPAAIPQSAHSKSRSPRLTATPC